MELAYCCGWYWLYSLASKSADMKKRIVKMFVYGVAACIIILGFMIVNNLLDRENIFDRISQWPDLQVNSLKGEPLSMADILDDKPIMLYYFKTECIFCQATFSDLPNYPELTERVNIVFISDEDPVAVRQFLTGMEISELSVPLFYHDYERQVKDFYAIRAVPAIYLYDREGKLIQFFRGAVGLGEVGSRLQIIE